MTEVVTGRSDEIERLYNSERRRLERMVTRKVGSSSAPDVVQDVFARIWESAKEHVVLTPSYLSRCACNSAIDKLRAEKRHQTLAEKITADQYAAPVPTPLQIVEATDDIRHLDAIIRLLPERTRHVFLLNRVHSCTYQEIAASMGLSYITVEREMAKAIAVCRAGFK
ncbi:sigma-70 family RNA polymerase sigma factor [Rhizobium sp. CRIBSB]|nr:sigma-70 family RNA polymerase sigma factor [Rhizobium sp. CRIBSB]